MKLQRQQVLRPVLHPRMGAVLRNDHFERRLTTKVHKAAHSPGHSAKQSGHQRHHHFSLAPCITRSE